MLMNKQFIQGLFLLTILQILPIKGNTAEISIFQDMYFEAPVMSISGEIVTGDYEKVKKYTKEIILHDNYKYLHVYLNSPGGNVHEAIKIGRFLRKLLATTYAIGYIYYDPKSKYGIEAAQYFGNNPEDIKQFRYKKFVPLGEPIPDKYIGRCYSACVLLFYAGVERAASSNGYFREKNKTIPVIGFHRAYYDKKYYSQLSPTDAEKKYNELKLSISSYLLEMGAPDEVAERMLKTASNKVDLIHNDELKKLYESKAPFLDEWLIAKCGEQINKEEHLTEDEYQLLTRVNNAKKNEARKYSDKYGEVFETFFPPNTNKKKYNQILGLVRSLNGIYHDCRKSAVHNHQKKWILSN